MHYINNNSLQLLGLDVHAPPIRHLDFYAIEVKIKFFPKFLFKKIFFQNKVFFTKKQIFSRKKFKKMDKDSKKSTGTLDHWKLLSRLGFLQPQSF